MKTRFYITLLILLISALANQTKVHAGYKVKVEKEVEFKVDPLTENKLPLIVCKGPFKSIESVFKKADGYMLSSKDPEKLKTLQIMFVRKHLSEILEKVYKAKDQVEQERILTLTMMDLVGCVDK